MTTPDLPTQIRAIPCDASSLVTTPEQDHAAKMGYALGHRDALEAAAALVGKLFSGYGESQESGTSRDSSTDFRRIVLLGLMRIDTWRRWSDLTVVGKKYVSGDLKALMKQGLVERGESQVGPLASWQYRLSGKGAEYLKAQQL